MKVIICLVAIISFLVPNDGLKCVKQLSTCSCETDLGLLNFSSLDAGGYDRWKFNAIDDSTGVRRTMQYNPCSAMICNFGSTAAACVVYTATAEVITGLQSTAKFVDTSGYSSIIIR